jgi:amino acid adenylation domain-containing protein
VNQLIAQTRENSPDPQLESLRYWQQQLSGSSPLLDLPTDKPRRSPRTMETAIQSLHLSPQLVASLETIARTQNVDLFTMLLAGFKVLIYRYIDRQDIVVGTPIFSPDRSAVNESTLLYLNHLVLRTDLSGNPKFSEILERTKKVFTAACQHQNLSFDRLIKILNVELSNTYHPIFQVLFSFRNSSTERSIDPVATDRSIPPDLAVKLTQSDEGISGCFEYSVDLFAPATIERMTLHFQTLLTAIVAGTDRSIDELPLLTAPEREQLLVTWNQTQSAYPDCCIHHLFEAQVERTPDNIALIFGEDRLTYRQLNARSNQVAHYLQGLGVGIGTRVGLYVSRSLPLMVGLLGILKAGATYVPIDPHHPLDRIEYILENAQIAILVTPQPIHEHLPTQSAIELICLVTDWAKIATKSTATPLVNSTPDQIAYSIYTSGSTGKPKGVEAVHRGVVNFIISMQQQPGMVETDILLSGTTFSFDMAVLEIFLPISVGATLVLISREDAMDGHQLATAIDRWNITMMQATPATWRLLLETDWSGDTTGKPKLKILTGAEPISLELVTKLRAKGASVWNLYGPTEATVWSTVYQVRGDESRVPIGKPIANTDVYILDSHLQPVPIGITGELYIGGAGLAKGYWQKPELTAEKFIPHPFNADPTARIYQTGDLARYLPNGDIECLGRIDFQVKLRGFRIELGEIETLLCQYPGIGQAVAIVREDRTADRRLVAYLILDPATATKPDPVSIASQLREFLAHKLPSYMVPAAFVWLERFPLTPNGKINRTGLPAPVYTRQIASTFVASQDELEQELTKMWTQVLGIDRIGITDNFFELGGHSLLAVRLITDIERRWHQKLPLATFLAAPTIVQFAKVIRQQKGSTSWSSLVPIQSRGSKSPLFCIHPVGGNILEYYPLSHYLGSEQPMYGLQSRGLDGVQAPLTEIEAMAADYIQEIQTIQPHGPYLLVGYSFGGLVAFEIACQLASQGKKVDLVALLDNESPNLTTVRPSLFQALAIHFRNLHQLKFQEKISYIRDRIVFRVLYKNKENREKEFLLDNWAEPLPPEYLQVLESNFQAGKNYLGKFYPGKITLFRSSIQPVVQALHPDLGWGDLVGGGVEVRDLAGHHSNLLKEPNIQVLAQELKSCIELIIDN